MTSERADSFSDVQCIGLRFQPHRNAAYGRISVLERRYNYELARILQITKATIKAWMSLNFCQIQQLTTELAALEMSPLFSHLTMPSRWYAERRRGFTEHHFGRLSSFSEKAHNL